MGSQLVEKNGKQPRDVQMKESPASAVARLPHSLTSTFMIITIPLRFKYSVPRRRSLSGVKEETRMERLKGRMVQGVKGELEKGEKPGDYGMWWEV